MLKLSHHDDKKEKWQSHTIRVFEDNSMYYNAEYDLISHDFSDLSGYGATKEEALEDFKKKFEYLLKEWIAFGFMLLNTEVIESDIVEVDCFGKEL